jgi:hypothetical protein
MMTIIAYLCHELLIGTDPEAINIPVASIERGGLNSPSNPN